MQPPVLPVLAMLSLSIAMAAQGPAAPVDPLGFARLKDFTAHRVSSNHEDWSSNDDSKRPIPGETLRLADLQGPGVVKHVWITVAANEYGWPRLLRFRVYYDGSDEPSVDAPLGDFFAVGHGFERPIQSLLVRSSSAGRARNCYWPMPFHRSCRITLTNEGTRRVSNVYYHVDWEKHAKLPADSGYFHARYRQALPAPADGSNYTILDVEGRGFYAGTVLSIVQAETGWFGEGDDFFWVDGQARPAIEGTGTEDYFNHAWSLHVEQGAYYGVPVAEGTGLSSRMTAYRWHVVDPIPFTTSLRFEMEHKGWTFREDGAVKSAFGERTDLMSSVAFWYQEGIARDLPAVPYGAARLPHGNARQIEVEAAIADCRMEKGKAAIERDLFWSKDVILFRGEGQGAALTVPFDVAEDGDYEVAVQLAQGADYGIYGLLLDGKPATAAVLEREPGAADVRPPLPFDGFAPDTYVGADYLVGWPRLAKGRHTLTFVCAGRSAASTGFVLGVDNLVLARIGPAGWAMAAQVREPRLPSRQIDDLARALADPDVLVRDLAALALRDMGAAAKPALPALIAALADPDPNVRLMSANAIAGIGAEAAAAMPALIAACSVAGEEVHVQRSCASALGAIGQPAAEALPVLRELAKVPRVRWAAEAAIRRIGG